MRKGKRSLAAFLVLAMLCTMMPEAFYAAAITEKDLETVESMENAESAAGDTDKPGEKPATEKEPADSGNPEGMEKKEGISAASFVADDYTFLTVGDPLSRTGVTTTETFAFQPDVSGWYHVKADSDTNMGINAAHVYIVDGEEKINGFQSWCFSNSKVKDNIFYGQAGDTYLFQIWPANGTADYTVSVDEANVSRVEAAGSPETVYDSLNFGGMQLKLIYADGTSTTTEIDPYGMIEAFYNPLNGENYFESRIEVESYDNSQSPQSPQPSIDSLEDGAHTAHAYILKYENGNTAKLEFTFDFVVEREAVDFLEVLSKEKTTYEAGFSDSFNSTDGELENEVVVRVNYKDGRTPKQISSKTLNTGLYQYLEMDGEKYETADDYLDNGGSLGQAEVHVSYRGVETTYQITIAENPYSGMDVTLNETRFYAGCGYEFGDFSYTGEWLYAGEMVDQVTLHYKDTSKRDETCPWYSLPGCWRRTSAGLKLAINGEMRLYQSVDEYLAAGGTIGEAVYQVNYAGVTAEVPVEICANPYSKIEIITPPGRTTYIEGKEYSIVTEGMVIRAYDAKDETSYTDITVPGVSDTAEDRSIFRHLSTRLGGHENTKYLEIGTHDVTVFYYGHSAAYEIEVVESLISDFTITKEPEYTEFLAGNTDGNWIELSGLEVSFTLNGERYENLQINSTEYQQLCEQYFEWIETDDRKVNFKKAGTYPVKVSFMGATAEYSVKVLDKIADSLVILSPPDKTAYYAGETESVDISGLALSVIGLDGQVTNYKAYSWEEDGYGSWGDIENGRYGYRLDTSSVNFGQPGTYEVMLCYGGVSDSFSVEIMESPAASIEINQMPQKMSYYQFEGAWSIDLKGLQFTIHYNDKTPDYHGVIEDSVSDTWVAYKSENYVVRSQWKNPDFYSDTALTDNAIVLSFLGADVQIPVSLLEDPVSEIKVMKNPQRMSYPPFEDNMADLYGAEIKLSYKDGTAETVSVQEHVSGVPIEKLGLELSASFDYWGNTLNLNIAGVGTDISLEKFDFSKEEVTETVDDQIQNVTLPRADSYKIFRFVPTEAKEYTFFSEGGREIREIICSADGSLAASGAGWSSCSVTAALTAGTTYYCAVKSGKSDAAGSFISCISSKRNTFTLSEADIEKFEVVKAPKTQYYVFENDISSENVPMAGLEYRITCKDKTVVEGCLNGDSYVYGVYIHGSFKYVTDNKLDMTKENAVIYGIGDCTAEVPITFSEDSPVESVILESSPWSQVMQYDADRLLYERKGLTLTVNYTDGTKRTVQDGEEWIDDGYSAFISFDWKNRGEDGLASAGENAVVITYMGICVEAPVLVKESTVKQILIVENPEKMNYLPFENEVDLYGLSLKAVDEDGKEETVKITEHGSELEFETGFGTGTVRAYIAKDENGGQCIKIDYMNCSAYYYPDIQSSYAELLKDAAEITMGQTVSVLLDGNVLYRIYRFAPKETMSCEFSSAGNSDTYVHLIDQYGETLSVDDDGGNDGNNFKLTYQLEGGKTYYYLVRLFDAGKEADFTCTLKSAEKELEIAEADITLDPPAAGEELPHANGKEGYFVHVSWTNAEDETAAEYARAYRAKILLTPDDGYVFAPAANIRLNGKKAVSKTYNSNGTITVYYTFPYTDCRIEVPKVEGYTLDESANSRKGQTEYGKSYSFRYQKTDESAGPIVVSADGKLLKADETGGYTITGIKSNILVSARIISEETKKDWTRLNFYDKETLSDSFYAERNNTVAASGEENVLPALESYVSSSDQFFFGWYESKDDSLNGIGKRFRSTSTVPDLDTLPLYAKWGAGIFSYTYNAKTVNYKVLSIDEENHLKVQIGDGRSTAKVKNVTIERSAAAVKNAPAEKSAKAVKNTAVSYRKKAEVYAAGNDDVFTIPGSITDFTGTGLDELGIAFSGCEVTAIAENAFSGDTDIRKISLPATITEIGAGAFRGCTNLESIEIPSSVAKIESATFSGCENLVDVVLAKGVTSIGENVFEGCSSLKTVVVPDSVEDIDATAFSNSADGLTIICSSSLTDVVSEAADAVGATVQTVDIVFDYAYADKEFTYGDKPFTVTAKLLVDGKENEERTAALSWKAAEGAADYYAVAQTANTMKITPKNATDGQSYLITAVDGASAQTKSIVLTTAAAPLDRVAAVEDIPAAVYTGSAVQPKVNVKLVSGGAQLTENADYTVEYFNNTEAGSQAAVKITGINNYCGEITKYFTIQKSGDANLQEKVEKIELNESKLRMKLNTSRNLTAVITPQGADQAVIWTSSNPSVATVSSNGTVKAIANGTAEIMAKADGKTAVCQVVVPYTITYKLNGGKNHALNPSDYYRENITLKNPSRAKYIFGGWYTDKKFKKRIKKIQENAGQNYVLYAKWTKISLGKSNVSSAKKSTSKKTTIKYKASSKKSKTRKLEVRYRKVKRADGYEIAYSTSKKYKKSATKTARSKKNRVTIKLKKGKTYYIRIRAYQVDSTGAAIYGKWTPSKVVNVKK